ncbi:hypothetical protein H8D85_02455 [bacterium]|nr:hypothetical protein [bacterium]
MGLDTYSSNNTLDYSGIELCGGMLSGNGEGSFRGKVYSDFIMEVSDVSLYQEEMPHKDLEHIVASLDNWLVDNVEEQTEGKGGVSWKEAYNLHKWFKVTLDGEAKVQGWW